MRRILYLSYDGLSDPLGQSQILPYLLALAAQGNHICIISAEKKAAYQQRKATLQALLLQQEGRVEWQPVFYTKKPPVLSTLWDMWKIYRKALHLHKHFPFELIHCRSYIAALLGKRLAKRFAAKWIFDMRGFWADERVEGGLWPQSQLLYRFLYRFFKKQEKILLEAADASIVLTHQAAQEIATWPIGLKQAPAVIPCCVDTRFFVPQGAVRPLQAPFRLVYLGSIGTWYLLHEMLDFFACLLQQRPEATFLFITTEAPQSILAAAEAKGIQAEALTIRAAERSEIPALLADCHASVFFIKPSYSKKASSATKMGEILAMGLPVVANAAMGDHDYLFQAYPCGVLVQGFEPTQYHQALEALLTLLESAPAQALRQTALDYFSLDEGVRRYAQVYQSLLPL
jgi:glycosyltransferase involved in cell wall biosynthesis